MSDHLPGPLHEFDQDVERSAAKRYRFASFLNSSFGHKQIERAKRENVLRS